MERRKLGTLLKRFRDQRALNQDQLGVAQKTASNMESGRLVPQRSSLQSVMDRLELTPAERQEMVEQYHLAQKERDEHGPLLELTGDEDQDEETVTLTISRSAAMEILRALRIIERPGIRKRRRAAKKKP